MKRVLGIVFSGLAVLLCWNAGSGEGAQMTTTVDLGYRNGQTLYSWVDALRVRAKPDPALASIANINTGDKVTYLGEASRNTATFVLRGREITGPFLKVKLADGTVGWVFAGGLQSDPPGDSGRVLTVGRRGADYTDLQKAIDNAQSGDTVHILEGSYSFRDPVKVDGKKNITIEGSGDRQTEIINLDSYNHVLSLSRCENVTIRNLFVHHKEVAYCYGAVINIEDSVNITVDNCDLEGCGVQGISMENCKKIRATGNMIHNNSEAGISINGNYSDIVIENNRLEYNGMPIQIGSQQIWDDSNLPANLARFIKLTGNVYIFEDYGDDEGDYYEGDYYGD